MDLLLTGRLASITNEFCDKLTERFKVAAASDDLNKDYIGKRVNTFKISCHEKSFTKIFSSYNFDAMVFMSQHPEESPEYFEELHDLENALKLCDAHDVKRVIYVASSAIFKGQEIADDMTVASNIDGLSIMLSACEQLCELYSRQRGVSVLVLRTPTLFGEGESVSIVGKAIAQAVDDKKVKLNANEKQTVDFLAQDDLGELITRVLDDNGEPFQIMNLTGASLLTMEQFGVALKNAIPEIDVAFTNRALPTVPMKDSGIARREYDWIPSKSVIESLPDLITSYRGDLNEEKLTAWQKFKNFMSKHKFILQIIELVLGFILMQFLNHITKTTIQFQYIDFRLLYVVLLGTIHGVRTGIIAGLLACVSLGFAYFQAGTDWQLIVYNIDGWLPFALFIILGAATGYTKDKLTNDNKFLKEQLSNLEDKYVMLNEFYNSALANKGHYKNQIMSYRDSFGRIFEVTKKLNETVPEAVFGEALSAFEDILENQTICIYSFDGYSHFGRLMLCSKKISAVTTKSIDLSKLSMMTQEFKEGEVWVNRERLLGYPEYASPIYRNDKIVALVTIQKVKYEQMAIYYENIVKVLCGLFQVSLLRAVEYTESIENKMYLPNSRIQNMETFRKTLEIKEKQSVDAVSEYSLIHINTTPDTLLTIGNSIMKTLRYTDTLGQGEDGELYLILAQTNSSNIDIVLKRIEQIGMSFQKINSEIRE